MALRLEIDDRGGGALDIPDAEGVPRRYLVSPAPPGLDACAFELCRTDTGEVHRVGFDRRGRCRCSCPDFFYRGRPRREPCKHCRFLRPLALFLLPVEA